MPRQGLLKATVGHFGGLSNVAMALETQGGLSESIWLQPGKVREVQVDLVSGSRMESKNVLTSAIPVLLEC